MGRIGDIIRIGLDDVVTSDVDVLQRLAGPKSPYTRSSWYGAAKFQKRRDTLFSMSDESLHAKLRNSLSQGYSGSGFMESGVESTISRLLDLIERKFVSTASEYKPMDVAVIVHLFAIDVIGEVTFGAHFGYLDEGQDIFGFLKWNEANTITFAFVAVFPWLSKILHSSWIPDILPKEHDAVGLGPFIR
jgi:hypothetical protein